MSMHRNRESCRWLVDRAYVAGGVVEIHLRCIAHRVDEITTAVLPGDE